MHTQKLYFFIERDNVSMSDTQIYSDDLIMITYFTRTLQKPDAGRQKRGRREKRLLGKARKKMGGESGTGQVWPMRSDFDPLQWTSAVIEEARF